ncbi:MAG: hypothetical protein PVH79_03295 [Candidatus Bathyarchaeota archaeon]
MNKKEEPPDQFKDPDGDIMRALFDIEREVEKSPPFFRSMLKELIDRIVEKRLEYYMPIEEEEEEEPPNNDPSTTE